MKRSRFSEEQIIGILKEHQAGLGAKELCRKHGISDATFYKWRSKYGGMEVVSTRLSPPARFRREGVRHVHSDVCYVRRGDAGRSSGC